MGSWPHKISSIISPSSSLQYFSYLLAVFFKNNIDFIIFFSKNVYSVSHFLNHYLLWINHHSLALQYQRLFITFYVTYVHFIQTFLYSLYVQGSPKLLPSPCYSWGSVLYSIYNHLAFFPLEKREQINNQYLFFSLALNQSFPTICTCIFFAIFVSSQDCLTCICIVLFQIQVYLSASCRVAVWVIFQFQDAGAINSLPTNVILLSCPSPHFFFFF